MSSTGSFSLLKRLHRCDGGILLRSTVSNVIVISRVLSSAEVSTALRPFFFSVHPDLFCQYPTERTVNENSLKHLNSYIETLLQDRPTRPATLTFYLRSQNVQQNNVQKAYFRSVSIKLAQRDIRKTVLSILQTCDLPTSYVESIPASVKPKPQQRAPQPRPREQEFTNTDYEYSGNFGQGTGNFQDFIRKTKETEHLILWLRKNVPDALQKLDSCKPVREEIVRLRQNLCQSLGVKDVLWDCGWNVTHFRGCLQSFQALANHHPDVMGVLRGRTLVFGNDTGVSLDGHVILNSGEVRHNWLDLIKNVRKHDNVLLRIPAVEKAVSQVLLDIKVVHRKFQPKVMAGVYENQLRKLTTSLGDYSGSRGYPEDWPESLADMQLVVETAAGPLMLSPTGQFIVPASCPASLVVNFISENLERASELLVLYESNKHIEKELHKAAMKELRLVALQKDDNITPDLMISCCKRLLAHKQNLIHLTEGTRLWVTHYYSVLSDGEICIPWSWKM